MAKIMKKDIILDSNVIFNDGLAMYNFKDNNVIIMDIVRTELATKKDERSAEGKNARIFNKELYKLAKENPRDLKTGVKINIDPNDEGNYGTIRIHTHKNIKPANLTICLADKDSRDHLILSEAKKIEEEEEGKKIIIVTDDYKFGTDCALEGIEHQPYKHDKLISDIKDIYKGYIYVSLEGIQYDILMKKLENNNKLYLNEINSTIKKIEIEDDTFLKNEMGAYQKNLISKIDMYEIFMPDYTDSILYPNEFIIFQKSFSGENTDKELLTFINFSNPESPYLEKVRTGQTVSNLKSKSIKPGVDNIQQEMFIHLSNLNYIEIVSGLGPAGSGKTLLAVAAGCEKTGLSTGYKQVTNNKANVDYKTLYVSRTFVTLEKDIGALPGDESEKTEPLFRPIKDNLEVIVKNNENLAENIADSIKFLTFTYLQGRSINDAIIILDEAQNTHIMDMESFITRSGDKSRIFLTGDPLQVRKSGVGTLNNGLTQMVELFKGCPFFGVVYMQQAVRSNKAEYASVLLNRM
jgi:PhoH-like ATPase